MEDTYERLAVEHKNNYDSLLTLYKALLVKNAIQQDEIRVLTNNLEKARSTLGIIRGAMS